MMGIPNPCGYLIAYGLPMVALAFCIAGSAYQGMQVDGSDHYGREKRMTLIN